MVYSYIFLWKIFILVNLVGDWSIEFHLCWWFSIAWKPEGFQDCYCNDLCRVLICCCLFFPSSTKPFLALANLHFQVRCFSFMYLEFQPYVNGNNGWLLIFYLPRRLGWPLNAKFFFFFFSSFFWAPYFYLYFAENNICGWSWLSLLLDP